MTRAKTIAELARITGHTTTIGLMNYLSRNALVSDNAVNLDDAATCDLERALIALMRGNKSTNRKP